MLEVLRYYHIHVGEDGHEFEDSADRKNWMRWTGKPGVSGDAPAATESAEKAA
jgi:phenol hydroxylase P3 protein